jgi:hypothetical protein
MSAGESTKPKLLAGGNPQIPKGDGDEPVQRYIAAMPDWKHDVGRALDQLIGETVPGVTKAVRWNTPLYGLEGNGWFMGYHCVTRYVKVSFFQGASLDPVPPVASKHDVVRYAHIHENEEIDRDLFASWIRQAAELPGWKP